jgi:2-desacetyl-2-hydroxyethyl bacteriochlorophyllide A dehydrogenase
VLVKTSVTGISAGTEMGLYKGTNEALVKRRWGEIWVYPMYPGYESVGRVVECGPGADRLKPGDRIISYGGHAEYNVVDEAGAVKLPDNISDRQATLSILGTTSLHGLRRGRVEYGDTVAVVGMGQMGQMGIQHARLAGAARTIAVDKDPWRLDMARRLGTEYCINPDDGDPVEAIARISDGGAHVVLETAGVAPAIPLAMALARDEGRVVIVGWHLESIDFEPGEDFLYKELELLASRGSGYADVSETGPRRWTNPKNRVLVIDMISRGLLRTEGLVTHVLPYTEISRAYEIIRTKSEPSLQVVLTWDEA